VKKALTRIMHSVLVLDDFPQTLAVVRSLARAGYGIIVGRGSERTLAERSRFCDEVWQHPDLVEPERFRDALVAFVRSRADVQTVFPVAEPSITQLLAIPELAASGVTVVTPGAAYFDRCLNKRAANRLAEECGLLVPETRFPTSVSELVRDCQDIGFPLIAKPVRSSRPLFGRKACILNDQTELESLFTDWPTEHRELLVQTYVQGTLEAADFVAANGRLVGYCEAHSVRTTVPDGTGMAVEFRSIPPSTDALAATRAFVQGTGYTGPGLIQYMRSAATGDLYFIENNPRLSAGIADSIAWGQDMPLLALEAAAGAELPEFNADTEPYRYHAYVHWLQRDVQGFFDHWSDTTGIEKLGWLRDMVRSLVRARQDVIWQWSDPVPGVLTYGRLARQIGGRVRRALLG
jgi:biotin carboxylase